MAKTRKNVPWKGWKNQAPGTHQRTVMLKKCGNKCFLGSNKSFPICKKNTCKVSKKGVYAAYVRAREYSSKTGQQKYKTVANRAKQMLQTM
jgi:hypothetical protein